MNPSHSPDPALQAYQDAEHLRLLSLGYYIWAGIQALFGLLPIFHVMIGLAMANGSFPMTPPAKVIVSGAPGSGTGQPNLPIPPFPSTGGAAGGTVTVPNPSAPPPFFGWFFVIFGLAAIAFMETLALLAFLTGRNLAARRGKTLIQIAAALSLLSVPLGTILGVFTFLVLSRPSVAPLFDSRT